MEGPTVKNTNPEQLLFDLPCIPIVQPQEGVNSLRLVSVQEGVKRRVLAAEDFPVKDRAVLEVCGVPFVKPGKRMRSLLGIEKASMLSALQAVFSRRSEPAADTSAEKNPRLFM